MKNPVVSGVLKLFVVAACTHRNKALIALFSSSWFFCYLSCRCEIVNQKNKYLSLGSAVFLGIVLLSFIVYICLFMWHMHQS
jgi:hypothetical protein